MKKLLLLLFIFFFTVNTFAQLAQIGPKPLFYTISFPNAVHHEAEVVLNIPQVPNGTLKVRMSRSSAGRYATHEFGKNIYNPKATDVDGNILPLKQLEGDVYELENHPETVNISYTVYADLTDGTYAGIDESHAHLNMPAVCMWVMNETERPIRIEFDDLDKYGWKVATQLKHEADNVYSAPNLQYLMDSPAELSNFKETSWTVLNTDGKTETIHIAAHSDDSQAEVDNFGKMVQKVVLEEKAVFGELPAYDFGEYTFLDDVYPTNSADGMEHRNSTCIVEDDKKIEGNEVSELSSFSHEFFHCWNIKRIRPRSLEPFNFEHANMSSELWFGEGFTQYYGEMLLVRSGFHTVDDYTRVLTGLVNSVITNPVAAKYSPVQMSNYSVFADDGAAVDPTNKLNMYDSYYLYGGAIALALDLRLRSEFNLSLDDYMKAVWLAVGKVQKPYTIPDLEKILAKLTNNPKFADDFFKQYIYDTAKNNYADLLTKAGLLIGKANPGKAWAGNINVTAPGRNTSGEAKTLPGPGLPLHLSELMGTPLYKAGLDAGDVIVKADGQNINDIPAFNALIAGKNVGDKIVINYTNRTGAHQTTITLEEDPTLAVITFENAGKELTKDQQDFRNSWLSSRVK
jgi:predicted metalloprotease with PDZ domain